MSLEIFTVGLNDEDRRRAEKFALECAAKVEQIQRIFGKDTRGMMQFMYTIQILREKFPALLDNKDANARIAEWLAAGEPEDLTGIADKIIERFFGGRPN